MSQASVAVELLLKDQMTNQLRRAERTASGFGKKMEVSFKAVAAAATAAVAAVGGFTATVTNLARQQLDSQFSLDAALRANRQDVARWSGTLRQVAADLQRITVFADGTIMPIMAMGLNMGISADKIEETTRAAIGLNEVTGGRLGLEQAMMGLAQAAEGNYTQLNRYVSGLRSATTDTERAAAVQDAANRGMEIASARSNTLTGRLQVLGNRFKGLGADIGMEFIPYLEKSVDLMEKLTDIVDKGMPGIREFTRDFISGLGGVTGAFGWAFLEGFKLVEDAIGAFNIPYIIAALKTLKDTILVLAEPSKLREFIFAPYYAVKQLLVELSKLSRVSHTTINGFSFLIKHVKSLFNSLVMSGKAVIAIFLHLLRRIAPVFLIVETWRMLTYDWADSVTTLAAVFIALATDWKLAFEVAFSEMVWQITNVMKYLDLLVNTFENTWKAIYVGITTFFTNVGRTIRTAFTNIGKNTDDLFKALADAAMGRGFNFEWTGLFDGLEKAAYEFNFRSFWDKRIFGSWHDAVDRWSTSTLERFAVLRDAAAEVLSGWFARRPEIADDPEKEVAKAEKAAADAERERLAEETRSMLAAQDLDERMRDLLEMQQEIWQKEREAREEALRLAREQALEQRRIQAEAIQAEIDKAGTLENIVSAFDRIQKAAFSRIPGKPIEEQIASNTKETATNTDRQVKLTERLNSKVENVDEKLEQLYNKLRLQGAYGP